MILRMLQVGMIQANCYIISCSDTGQAAVIDPGDDGGLILDILNDMGLVCNIIINTHGHADHIGANSCVSEATGAPVAVHEDDVKMLEDPALNLSAFIGLGKLINGPAASRILRDGDLIRLGGLTLECIHTPGHTPGSICIRVGGLLFSGDTLFRMGVGRTDFPGGDVELLEKSLTEKLFILPDSTVVYPGHGSATTIRDEKGFNFSR